MASLSVLVVAAGPSECACLAADLVAASISMEHADTLAQALQRQAESPAGAVLCDADCVDWREALDSFRRLKTAAPVIFLTRRADERLWLQMLERGAFDLLARPYRPEELRFVVSCALHRPTAATVAA